ncbi:MAG: hypothetical protein EOP47_20565 [Sphingobacteriaceae bacterium]|nr:MAG: hypothetical protein EOP47_20565 [Sphingobacteriaceae bacterium]
MKSKILVVFVMLFGCTEPSNFVRLLTSESKKTFWIQKKLVKSEWIYSGNQWIFNSDGSAKCLVSFDPDRKGTPAIINVEGSSDYSWNYEPTDNVLDIGTGVRYKIVKYNTDTILMKNSNGEPYALILKR